MAKISAAEEIAGLQEVLSQRIDYLAEAFGELDSIEPMAVEAHSETFIDGEEDPTRTQKEALERVKAVAFDIRSDAAEQLDALRSYQRDPTKTRMTTQMTQNWLDVYTSLSEGAMDLRYFKEVKDEDYPVIKALSELLAEFGKVGAMTREMHEREEPGPWERDPECFDEFSNYNRAAVDAIYGRNSWLAKAAGYFVKITERPEMTYGIKLSEVQDVEHPKKGFLSRRKN